MIKIVDCQNKNISATYSTDSIKTYSVHPDFEVFEFFDNQAFNIDTFHNSSVNNPVFKASDGSKYDVKETLFSRLYDTKDFLYTNEKNLNAFEKASRWFTKFIGHGDTFENVLQKMDDTRELISSNHNIKKCFKTLTGYEYNDKNIEEFLKGNIKLKIELETEKYMGKKLDISSAAPLMDEWKHNIENSENTRTLNKDETKMYYNISKNLPEEYREKLKTFEKSGIFLDNKSNDGTTVLENLYKILNTPRIDGVDGINILKECLDIIENPCVITQLAEDIPDKYLEEAIKNFAQEEENITEEEIKERLEYRDIGTCAAASIEYYLAHTNISEFIRIIEGISSQKHEVKRTIKMDENTKEQLELFKTPNDEKNGKSIILIKPDEEALWLAKIQNSYKDEFERSIVDILMQSAIMNLGSRQSYNSLTDKRAPNERTNADGGLIDTEISYVKGMLTDIKSGNKLTMGICDNGKIIIREPNNAEKAIEDELKNNGCVVVGIVFSDDENNIVGGHEVTIIGTTTNINGEKFFVCQDSDDHISYPSLMRKDDLKNVHHVNVNEQKTAISFGSLTESIKK